MTTITIGNCITNSNGVLPVSQSAHWNLVLDIGAIPLGVSLISGLLGYFILDIPLRRKLGQMEMPITEKGIPFFSYVTRLYGYVCGVLLESYRHTPIKSKRFNPKRLLHYNDMVYGREVNMRALVNRLQLAYCWLFAISVAATLLNLIPFVIHEVFIYPDYAEFRDFANEKLSYWRRNPETPFPELGSLPKECR